MADVLTTLEMVAFTGKSSDVRAGLVALRKSVVDSPRPSGPMPDLFAHIFARQLFEVGADIVIRRATARDAAVRRALMDFASSKVRRDRFDYEEMVEPDGSSRLVPVSAHHENDMIALAFLRVAPTISRPAWRRYKTRHCARCGRGFRDLRPRLRGPMRVVCSDECRSGRDRHLDRRKKRRKS